MGEQNVRQNTDEATHQAFMKALLNEVRALEALLEAGLVETGVRRIGAEQEMFLINRAHQPAMRALDVLEHIEDERFTHELGLFNLEANLTPHAFGGDCLRQLHEETNGLYHAARAAAAECGADVALVGILPTLSRDHLGLDAMVPTPRYQALNDALLKLRGKDFQFTVNGIDQLSIKHGNVMLEACNTSYQVHFQVGPEEFAHLYNIAQAITGPLLAAATNSPVLLGKRLWHETRIAVFEHSVDARSETHQTRGLKPRVHFGDRWIDESVTEIFKEDIARFRIILTTETEDDPMGMVEAGQAPRLNALRLHNGTVYRWNRPCYGVANGVPHLRIENRVIPSGPTVIDEIANSAFFFGLMSAMSNRIDDIRHHLDFDDAKSNFLAAARDGIRAQMTWFDDRQVPVRDLIRDELLPLAREGLERQDVDEADIDEYLGVLERRVDSGQTGARWMLKSLANMGERGTLNQRLRCLVGSMVDQQTEGHPVAEWELAAFCEEHDWRDSYRVVSQFMATDLFTVRPDDIVDFAASLMDWRHVRHVPVEDDEGQLVGLVSHRALLRLIAAGRAEGEQKVTVSEIMNPEPMTVTPDTPTVEAIRLMREEKVACLPVVDDGKLVGLITEHDLIVVSSVLLEQYLDEDD